MSWRLLGGVPRHSVTNATKVGCATAPGCCSLADHELGRRSAATECWEARSGARYSRPEGSVEGRLLARPHQFAPGIPRSAPLRLRGDPPSGWARADVIGHCPDQIVVGTFKVHEDDGHHLGVVLLWLGDPPSSQCRLLGSRETLGRSGLGVSSWRRHSSVSADERSIRSSARAAATSSFGARAGTTTQTRCSSSRRALRVERGAISTTSRQPAAA